MNKKDMFIAMVEEMIVFTKQMDGCHPMYPNLNEDALAYFEAFKTSIDKKEKPQFTDNGKLILKTMIESVDEKQNMFKARDIAVDAFISARSVSGSIRKLVTDGYVEKMGQDPIIYSLTELGKGVKFDD